MRRCGPAFFWSGILYERIDAGTRKPALVSSMRMPSCGVQYPLLSARKKGRHSTNRIKANNKATGEQYVNEQANKEKAINKNPYS
jgi:hypothetical protein